MARRKPKSPAQTRRNALAEAIKARGHSPYNIWVVRPPFEKEDILLNSDVAHEFFYFLEGEPSYVEISYAAMRAPAPAGSTTVADRVFAEVVTRNSKTLDIYFSHSPHSERSGSDDPVSAPAGRERVVVGVVDLDANAQRIENWRRIIPCIRRVQAHPVAALERHVLLKLRDGERRSLRDVVGALLPAPAGLAYGAIATLLRKRHLSSDLETRPWSLDTRLWSVSE